MASEDKAKPDEREGENRPKRLKRDQEDVIITEEQLQMSNTFTVLLPCVKPGNVKNVRNSHSTWPDQTEYIMVPDLVQSFAINS